MTDSTERDAEINRQLRELIERGGSQEIRDDAGRLLARRDIELALEALWARWTAAETISTDEQAAAVAARHACAADLRALLVREPPCAPGTPAT